MSAAGDAATGARTSGDRRGDGAAGVVAHRDGRGIDDGVGRERDAAGVVHGAGDRFEGAGLVEDRDRARDRELCPGLHHGELHGAAQTHHHHAPFERGGDRQRSVVRMAVENPQWGYTRIRGALSNLGHEIARTTVKRILHDHGIDPAPERSRRLPGKTFLQAHWEGLTASDLFTVEVLTLAGPQRYLVFFVIALQSRRVTIAGIHPQPYGTWMEQMARTLTDPVDGCLRRARYLIHDRDPLYTRGFSEILEGGGVQPIRLPPKSPNLTAYAERFVRSMKEECLSRVVPLGEGHVRLLVGEDVDHDHRERNHQGLDNQLLATTATAGEPGRRRSAAGASGRIAQFLPPGGRMSGRPIKRTLRHEARRTTSGAV